MRPLLRSLGLALLLGATPALGAPVQAEPTTQVRPPYREMHALIVGIDHYEDGSIDLGYAVSDADGVAEVLNRRFGFASTTVLRNEEATRTAVLEALDGYRKLHSEDALFIFWAGHGTQEDTASGDALGYLVPHDGSLSPDRLMIDNLSMGQLKDVIGKRIPAKHKLLVVDACYGGILATRDAKRPEQDLAYIAEATREPAFQVMTAGRADQPVLDGGPGGHSVFTGRLIESLEGVGQFATASMLHAAVAPQVRQDAFDRGERVQTPVFANLLGLGDFVFMPTQELADDPRLVEAADIRGLLSRSIRAEAGACQISAERLQSSRELYDRAEGALLAAIDTGDAASARAELEWMRGLKAVLEQAGCP